MRGAPLALGLLCWLLLLCFANGTAKMVAMVLLMLCFESLSFALVLLKHAMACNCYGLLYTNLFVRYLILMSKYHAEPPTLTRLGASADFLSIELTITYK